MRFSLVIVLLGLVLLGSGCSSVNEQAYDGERYVFEKKDGKVLILGRIEQENIGKKWEDLYKTYQGDAIWLKTNKSGLKVGQHVRYWIKGGVDDSFPAQGAAKKIKIVE